MLLRQTTTDKRVTRLERLEIEARVEAGATETRIKKVHKTTCEGVNFDVASLGKSIAVELGKYLLSILRNVHGKLNTAILGNN